VKFWNASTNRRKVMQKSGGVKREIDDPFVSPKLSTTPICSRDWIDDCGTGFGGFWLRLVQLHHFVSDLK